MFDPGVRNNLEETILRATGERLDPDYFAESLREGRSGSSDTTCHRCLGIHPCYTVTVLHEEERWPT